MLRMKRKPLVKLREWGKKNKLDRNTMLNAKPISEPIYPLKKKRNKYFNENQMKNSFLQNLLGEKIIGVVNKLFRVYFFVPDYIFVNEVGLIVTNGYHTHFGYVTHFWISIFTTYVYILQSILYGTNWHQYI